MKQADKIISAIKIMPAGFYNGLIWTISSMQLPFNLNGYDKSAHILEYAGLGFLLAFGYGVSKDNFDSTAKSCIIIGIFAGVVDEIHQYYVPGRSTDIIDLIADLTGISLGILVWLTFTRLLSFIKLKFSPEIQ